MEISTFLQNFSPHLLVEVHKCNASLLLTKFEIQYEEKEIRKMCHMDSIYRLNSTFQDPLKLLLYMFHSVPRVVTTSDCNERKDATEGF